MQLVMRRQRLERAFWHNFKINARMVVDSEETGLVDKYKLHNVTITPGDVVRDLKKAVGIAIIITLMLFFGGMPPGFAFIVFVIGCFLIYHQIREEVRVSDLLTGRDFKARSFLDLLHKEHRIREPEVIELEPQPLFTLVEGERAPA